MNGDTFSRKAPKECSNKLAATFEEKLLTTGNVLFFSFLEDTCGASIERFRHSSYCDSGYPLKLSLLGQTRFL